jgi:type II secretion system protein N
MMIKLKKSQILLGLYIVGLLAFFLYLGFPSDHINTYMVNQINGINPQIEVTIERIAPALPPGIRLYHVDLYHREHVWGRFENIKIIPHLFSLFGSQKGFSFAAKAYAGEIKGTAEFEKNSPVARMVVDTTLTGLQVKDVDAIQALSEYSISGLLDGTLAFQSDARNQILKGDLSLSDVRVDLTIPLFNQGSLEFNDVTAQLVLNNHNLTIENCRLKGKQLDASVSGSIMLNRDFSRGTLNLEATIDPHHLLLAAIKKSLPFVFLKNGKTDDKDLKVIIRGTTDAPEFSLK